MTSNNYYANHETPEGKLRRIVIPKIRQFVENADTMGGGLNKDRPDGIVTGHELYRALKDMFRKTKVEVPFTPKDLIREANIHSGPLAGSDKERFVDMFSDKIVALLNGNPQYEKLDEVMFDNFAASA